MCFSLTKRHPAVQDVRTRIAKEEHKITTFEKNGTREFGHGNDKFG